MHNTHSSLPHTFFAINYYNDDEYYLEDGDEFLYEVDDMLDEDVETWARDSGYLDDDDYLDEDGNPNIDSLREAKRQLEEDYPSTNASPSGRAFSFFEHINQLIPESLEVKIVDGLYPSNDWQGVIVKGLDTLTSLKNVLEKEGYEVNFIIKDFRNGS